mmetsp:Transcript_13893/g.23027  ORF Transcript_13893/g.23027 Transcript_13893/m.23027 type:complete len:323 (-) Transcript_13893:375-1343(-)
MAFRGFFKSSLVAFLSFSLLLLGCGTVSAQPSMGPYETTQAMYDVEALDETNRTAWVWSPVASNTDESFPLIIYLHGFLGGNTAILGYSALFQQLASYGFIVAAPLSCIVGCTDASVGAPWTDCQGILPLRPPAHGWGPYYGEGIKLIDWARNMTNLDTDPLFQRIDWEKGVGFTGHSMGGQATTVAASAECTQQWNIKAVALHHPAEPETRDGNIGVNISVPAIAFTSSGDSIWPDTKAIMDANPMTPAAYRDEVGWSHEEPNGRPDTGMEWENPRLATFTAAWFQVMLNGDQGFYHDLIFSDKPTSLCQYADMVECYVES